MKTILKEDDCAPDARQFFEEEFKRMVGESRVSFIRSAKRRLIDKESKVSYTKDGYELSTSADDPYWKLKIEES